ncbi:DUF4176 domain-containing protein [Enterococcus sp. BWR-S5]|uniref:DUF4176 domain-containing protein n=1 Tax=Enterococcus sp. BWR-S5 TaxID=2787714 RepID=UPI0019232D23|nr:DUF4176 domain-containing protein [Enterococcus sp. BWR-S5]MBL1224264.1 DUF4176 domain-containing protein [Enterococcus sp. BWR-S5]
METTEFLPLGTICIVKGNTKKLMVIARGVATVMERHPLYFDYGACLYPEGLLGDSLIYFNHEDIQKTVHEGYVNDENELMLENLAAAIKESDIPKGNVYQLQQKEV